MTEHEKSGNVTILAENYGRAPTATVSSLKSEDSTEQLICKSPQKTAKDVKKTKKQSVSSKSVEAGSDNGGSRQRLVVFLGLGQVILGALLVGAGAVAVVKGAALSRVGAGLWAGCVAVVAGVVGVLAGINDCYGLNGGANGHSPLLTAFLALSLLCLACGNSAAVLAATGLQRDSMRAPSTPPATLASFEDEMEAWTPVLTNIALLIIASVHCLVCIVSIYHLSKRICPCFRPKQAFDHNQFDPTFKTQPYVIHVDEKRVHDEKLRSQELCKDLEVKLQGETLKKKKDSTDTSPSGPEYGSANSKEKLVTHWLGRHHSVLTTATTGGRRRPGVRKPRRHHAPVVLLPAHHATTLGRGRVPVSVVPPPRYATLPLPPGHFAPHPHPHHPPHALYYPLHDTRIRRRRSPRSPRQERRRAGGRGRERDSQLTRSLERIHRKRRAERERMTDADLKRTYTGLDRAYAEQFIAVCDESRHAAEQHDSLGSTTSSSDTPHSHGDL
ncbi:uncharacterized protein LOC113515328 [Galleria mellonella]|uniref:Uncharacterized protein LOC113515328 n=1 Tax=Galleria mellonella TaxID=7137 RepID=A0ABM3N6U7_GALME|nr:uncharacterized protein LOC113515328 [Galleria mellonella]